MIEETKTLLGSYAELYEFQPATIYYIQNSSKFDEIIYEHDEHFYGFNYKIKLNKNKIKSVIHYILGKQEIDITNPCTLCNTFKTKVIFTKCKHKFCITCALKSNNCNICRAEISDVQKLLF